MKGSPIEETIYLALTDTSGGGAGEFLLKHTQAVRETKVTDMRRRNESSS